MASRPRGEVAARNLGKVRRVGRHHLLFPISFDSNASMNKVDRGNPTVHTNQMKVTESLCVLWYLAELS